MEGLSMTVKVTGRGGLSRQAVPQCLHTSTVSLTLHSVKFAGLWSCSEVREGRTCSSYQNHGNNLSSLLPAQRSGD